MERLTKTINGYAHGAEGVSIDKLTGNYCRGNFEATAIVERLAEYEAIGTVEECRAEAKKKKAMKPKNMEYKRSIEAGWHYACPACGGAVGENGYDSEVTQEDEYCSNCGQKLDWGSEGEDD